MEVEVDEVDGKQKLFSGVVVLKLSVFALLLQSYFMFKLKFMLNLLLSFS